MRISVMVCDDLAEERAALARMVGDYCRRKAIEVSLESAAGGEELLERWRPGRWDLVFLDIFMPGLSGVETARRLRQKDTACALIFATTSQEHGLESFELRVMDYLVKPFDQSLVDQAMDWFVQRDTIRLRQISVGGEWQTQWVRPSDVAWLEMRRHTATIQVGDRTYEVRRTMEALEAELEDDRFFRCHRSYLVNLDRVQTLEDRDFLMEDGTRIPISAKHLSEARQRFQEWQLAKNWGS